MSPSRLAVPALVGWTVFLWLSRVRNVLADDDLSTGGTTVRIAIAAAFVVLAVVAFAAWRRRSTQPGRARLALAVLCLWTVAFWLVRGIGIIVDDHSLGFTVIHTVLMVVSIGLAAWAWPLTREPAATPQSTS